MKTILPALFAFALLAGALPAAAQPEKDRPSRPEMGPGGPGREGPGEGLSDEQREKLEAAMKAEREAAKPLQRELRDALTKLKDLLEDEASDKQLQAGMDRVEKAHKAIQDQREQSQAKMRSLLPLRQRAMMMVRMGQGMDRMREGFQMRREGRRRERGMRGPGMREGRGEGAEEMPPRGPEGDDGPEHE